VLLSLSLFLLLSPSSLVHVLKPIPPPLQMGLLATESFDLVLHPLGVIEARQKERRES
jgi:hypothetical protein